MPDATIIRFPDRQTSKQHVRETVWVEVMLIDPDHVGYRVLDRSVKVTDALLASALVSIAENLMEDLEDGA